MRISMILSSIAAFAIAVEAQNKLVIGVYGSGGSRISETNWISLFQHITLKRIEYAVVKVPAN